MRLIAKAGRSEPLRVIFWGITHMTFEAGWDSGLRSVPAVSAPTPPSQAQIAERIAREAHAGQKEASTGEDYIHHVERVVAMVEGEEAKAVAWLHDVIEDTNITIRDLCRAGLSDDVIDAVERLTRDVADSYYADYIEIIRACGSQVALAVKLADLRDHLRPNCPERLRPRYEKALAVLTAGR